MAACLRDLLHANPTLKPVCFYCGDRAETVDHSKPRAALGTEHGNNLRPACRRCNSRKKDRTREAFRRQIARAMAKAHGERKIRFYGEGARGFELRRLRDVLHCVTVRGGKLVRVAPGERLTPPRTKEQRAKDRDRPRWRGRFTFEGGRALRAIAIKTGCSAPVIERFMLGAATKSDAKIARAIKRLGLDLDELRGLKPAA